MRGRRVLLPLLLSAAASFGGCGNSNHGGKGGSDGGGGGGGGGPGTLTIMPTDVTLDVINGMPAPSVTLATTYRDDAGDHDVGKSASFVISDPTLGAMVDNVFTATGDHGGTTTVTGTYKTLSAAAIIHIKLHGNFAAGDCKNCPTFPDDNAPACAMGAAPHLVYPTDGVLLPPNLNQFEIHFTQGAGATLHEVDFQNAVTDVRITTTCPAVTDTRGMPVMKGCVLAIDPQWDFIAKSNKGGDPITVTVRASTDGSCAIASDNTVAMSVAEEDTVGGLYYWKSKFTPMGSGGDIWRKAFGSTKAEEKITPDTLNGNFTSYPCWGCHSLSRDGSRMTINVDDSDSDDEYSDTSAGLFDVGKKAFITKIGYAVGYVPGFQTFNNDHSIVLGSDGDGFGVRTAGSSTNKGNTNLFYLWKGGDGTDYSPASVTVGMPGARPTMPDWSLDNKQVVFVMPTKVGYSQGGLFSNHPDDAHVFGGSIFSLPYDKMNGFGMPIQLVKSTGDNNYYPSISPDGSWIVYNHVPRQNTPNGNIDGCTPKGNNSAGSCPNDSFSNPKARLALTPPMPGGQGFDLALANGSPTGAPVDYSNSWPRWSPFVQKYKGTQLLWITFSSTRDYGLRVRNHVAVKGQNQVQCYPADSPEDPGGRHGEAIAPNCQQPQIWMAAINITGGEMGQVGDPSHPAFWLPFQDISTHNHTAQWTSNVVNMPGGDCAKSGDSCLMKPCCPNEGVCLANGSCGVP